MTPRPFQLTELGTNRRGGTLNTQKYRERDDRGTRRTYRTPSGSHWTATKLMQILVLKNMQRLHRTLMKSDYREDFLNQRIIKTTDDASRWQVKIQETVFSRDNKVHDGTTKTIKSLSQSFVTTRWKTTDYLDFCLLYYLISTCSRVSFSLKVHQIDAFYFKLCRIFLRGNRRPRTSRKAPKSIQHSLTKSCGKHWFVGCFSSDLLKEKITANPHQNSTSTKKTRVFKVFRNFSHQGSTQRHVSDIRTRKLSLFH